MVNGDYRVKYLQVEKIVIENELAPVEDADKWKLLHI